MTDFSRISRSVLRFTCGKKEMRAPDDCSLSRDVLSKMVMLFLFWVMSADAERWSMIAPLRARSTAHVSHSSAVREQDQYRTFR